MASDVGLAGWRPVIDRVWFDTTPGARLARAALSPLAAAYGAVTLVRHGLYAARLLPVHDTAVPAVSVGNLTVGGTGKTPVAAWMAAALVARGRRPAIALRGYGGGDEAAVHRVLNPGLPVIVDADRVAAVRRAATEGCDVVVLDDAFQHRRVRRVADVVLVNADQWQEIRWPLPAGPWREPLGAIRRATAVIIARKMADRSTMAAVSTAIRRAAPDVPLASASLVSDALCTLDGARRPLGSLEGARVRAVAGVAWPATFFAQLAALGATVDGVAFPDHHRYTPADIAAIRRRAAPGVDVICTLKDVVKLGGLWPREAGPLWYVSQRVEFDSGVETVLALLDSL